MVAKERRREVSACVLLTKNNLSVLRVSGARRRGRPKRFANGGALKKSRHNHKNSRNRPKDDPATAHTTNEIPKAETLEQTKQHTKSSRIAQYGARRQQESGRLRPCPHELERWKGR